MRPLIFGAGPIGRRQAQRLSQPPVFNLYYWLTRWLEPMVFSKLFGSRSAEVRLGLHAPTVGPELLEMAGMETPSLAVLLDCVRRRTVRD